MILTSKLAFSSTAHPNTAQMSNIDIINNDLQAGNQFIATKWDQLNRSVDMFFTNQGSLTSENKSSIFAYTSFTKSEGAKLITQYDFQLKFDLPNTTKKLKIVIEKQQDEISDVLSDNAVSNNKTITKDGKNFTKTETHYNAGVNYFLSQSKYFSSFLHFGIRLDLPLNPSLKLNMEKVFKTDYVNIGLLQKFILYRQEGFQEISQLSFNKKLNNIFQVDLINSLVWSDETDIFVLRNNFVLSQDLGNEKSLSYSIGANARFSPTFFYDSYDTSISYRQLLYNTWLYGTLAVGANFPKTDHFKDEKFVQIRIDVFFKK
ncbi:MAG: hypothetical protein H7281_12090 [Bacteriovorax sp.]|nr:hypothetical protein [Bacteriovorax sp.]